MKSLGAVALVVVLVGGAIAACAAEDENGLAMEDGDGGLTPVPSPTLTPSSTATTEPPLPLPDAGDDAVDGGRDAGADADADAGPPPPPVHGLDERPANTTCKAPSRPPTSSPVQLDRVYASLFTGAQKIDHPMIMQENGGRWYLAQRNGRVVSFKTDGTDFKNVMTTAQLQAATNKTVMETDEGGFHGLVFDPKFGENRRVYVAFSTSADANYVDPYRHDGNTFRYAEEVGYFTLTESGALTDYKRLMHIGRWYTMHFSGSVVFGNDGYLYISSGDGTDDSLPQWTERGNYYGKILRIDPYTPANGKNYSIPPTNPFAGSATNEPTLWAWGLRNPFQMTVDRATGDIFLGDVGQDSWEEVDRITRGANYGWPCLEGNANSSYGAHRDPYKCKQTNLPAYTAPLHAYPHVNGGGAVIGGHVYRGNALPALQGNYVFADYMFNKVSTLTQSGPGWTAAELVTGNQYYSAFAEDASNELYLLAVGYGGDPGSITKVVPRGNGGNTTFPAFLSQTGCVDPADPARPARGTIPYDLNAPLYSDDATKERWFAIPDGTTIGRKADGDFDFPIGTVLVKMFSLGGKPIETRLMVRHTDGEWGGYSYEWNTQGTDAVLLPQAGKSKTVGTQTWLYPGRTECFRCHTEGAGRSLGLEAGQLNRDLRYAATGKTANQLVTLDHIGMFTVPLGDLAAQPAFPPPFDGAASEAKARAYLHSNCSGCHRPDGAAGRANVDLRYATPFKDTKTCNVVPILGNVGGDGTTRIVKAGDAASSALWLRMHSVVESARMPPIARSIEDTKATALVKSWIDGLQSCPQ